MDESATVDVQDSGLAPVTGSIAGSPYLDNLLTMAVGAGSRSMHVDKDGQWMGADKFADAPFSVSMAGAIIASLLTIRNQDGDIILDPTGLSSTTNFLSDNVASSALRSISGSAWTDLTSASLTTSAFARTVNLLISYSVVAEISGVDPFTPGSGQFVINIDGVNYDQDFYIFIKDTAMDDGGIVSRRYSQSISSIVTLTAGAHTIKIMWQSFDSMNCYQSSLTYLVLGS